MLFSSSLKTWFDFVCVARRIWCSPQSSRYYANRV